MKKWIALLLCVCMLCPIGLAAAPVQVVQAADSAVVLFENDFEGETVGANVSAKANTINMWTHCVINDGVYIRVAEDAQQGHVAKFSTTDTSNRGPRLQKTFYFDDTLTNMTVTYKFKTESSNLSFYLYFADGSQQSFLAKSSSTWSTAKIEFDFSKGTYVSYVNDAISDSGKIKYDDISTLQMRFATSVSAEKNTYLDDVVVTTTSPVDVADSNDVTLAFRAPEEIMAPYAPYPHAPSISIPSGKYEMFNYDCSLNANNGISTGTDALWSSVEGASQAILNADKTNDGKLIRMTNDLKITQLSFLSKKLSVGTAVKEIGVEYYAVLSDSATYVELKNAKGDILVTAKDAVISEKTPGAVADSWNRIKAVFNMQSSRLNLYVNDTLAVENIAFEGTMPADSYEASVYIYGKLVSADTVLLDNFIMYQDAEPQLSTVKYYGTTGTNWSLVAADVVLTEDSFVNNMRQHPRIMVHDLAKVKAQIQNDPTSAAWYADIKTAADAALEAEPYTYKYGNGRNILDVARKIGNRLWYLAFAYLIEGDDKYVERGLEEMRNAATFPDWSNNAPIIPSEIMLGFAGFYDWCYNSPVMTDAVKEEMIQIIKDQALWQFVRSYDGVISAEIAKGTSNRTTVANSAAGLFAIAVADEYPQLAQFLLDHAFVCMKPAMNVYGSDGAYPEGASYWSYPMRTITPFLSSVQSAAADGYTLPADAQWYFDNEALNNTLDYWAYVSGATANFDFGDASPGLGATPAIYWHAQKNATPFHSWYAKHILAKTNSNGGEPYFSILWYDPEFEAYNDGMPLDKTFDAADTAQIASMRSSWSAEDAVYAAIQGGSNSTGHMFKSLGTFVIDANGRRFIRTIGRSDYSALYSSYMYYNERAEGQNTIIANPGEGFDQKKDAVARFVAHDEAENEAYTVLDMTETNDAFIDAKRGMFMTKGRGSVILQDEVKMAYPSELWWFAHTDAEIYISGDGKGALLRIGNDKMYARIIDGPADAQFISMPARPLPSSPVAPDEIYVDIDKLAIHLQDVTEATLSVEFVPIKAQEAVPTKFSTAKPISEWSVSDDTVRVARQAGYVVAMAYNSPNALVLEEKKLIDAKDTTIAPFISGGKYMVPAKFVAESAMATATVSESAVTVTKNHATQTITSGLVTKNGVVYAPANTLATALGMKLYTYDGGLIVFSDTAVNYTNATRTAIVNELKTRVYVDDRDFVPFTTDKTEYYIPYTIKKPVVRVDGAEVEQSENAASFVLDGKTYTFNFVLEEINFLSTNVLLGVIPTATTPLGNYSIPEYMTDGNLGTHCGTQSTAVRDVTYTLDIGSLQYIYSLELTDERPAEGSVVETAIFTGLAADGTWIDLGTMADLEAGEINGVRRKNTIDVITDQPVSAIRMRVKNTDTYIGRHFVKELKAIGRPYIPALEPCSTETTYATEGNSLKFTTNFNGNVPESAYLVIALYRGDTMCGLKIVPYAGEESLVSPLDQVDFDTATVMLVESFINMRILAEPENI